MKRFAFGLSLLLIGAWLCTIDGARPVKAQFGSCGPGFCETVKASGGGAGCSQATTFLARTTLTGTDATNYTNLICSWVTNGVITGTLSGAAGCGTYFDAIYVLATHDATNALLNLCGTNFSLTPNNSPTFTAYSGFTGNGSNAYLDTGANPGGTWSGVYSQNSAHWSQWSVTNPTTNEVMSGNNNNGSSLQDFGGFTGRVNDTNTNQPSVSDFRGHIIGNRANSTSDTFYQNGVSLGSFAANSNPVVNNNFYVLWTGNVPGFPGPSRQTFAFYSIGGDISGIVSGFYAPLRTYMTAVGVP